MEIEIPDGQLCENDDSHGLAEYTICWLAGDPALWADPTCPPTIPTFYCRDCYEWSTAPIEHGDYPCNDRDCDTPACTDEQRAWYKTWLAAEATEEAKDWYAKHATHLF